MAKFMAISDIHGSVPKKDVAEKLIDDGIITGGMIPKVRNCFRSIEGGVNRVHILDGSIPHCLLLEIFTDRGVGTVIMKDGVKYYSRERSN